MLFKGLFFTIFISVTFFTRNSYADTCQQEDRLQILGSGGPELNDNRTSSSYLLWHNKEAKVLLDAGSGSSIQFGLGGADFENLELILLSHLHTDHSADLPAFVKGSFFTPREADLWVLGPGGNARVPSTSAFIQRLFSDNGAFSYLSDYLKPGQESYLLKSGDVIDDSTKLFRKRFSWGEVSAIRVNHGPIPAVAWRVNLGECSLAYSGDMSNKTGKFAQFAKGVDLLILHMAIPENAHVIAKNLHMTPSQIAEIIQVAKPKAVLLSHFMRRSERGLQASLKIIEDSYKGRIYLAKEQLSISLKTDPIKSDSTNAESAKPPPVVRDSAK